MTLPSLSEIPHFAVVIETECQHSQSPRAGPATSTNSACVSVPVLLLCCPAPSNHLFQQLGHTLYVCVYLCVCSVHASEHMWMSEDNLRGQSLPSTLLETSSLVDAYSRVAGLQASGFSLVFASHLSLEELGSQICAMTP